jgi:hypothetical protein
VRTRHRPAPVTNAALTPQRQPHVAPLPPRTAPGAKRLRLSASHAFPRARPRRNGAQARLAVQSDFRALPNGENVGPMRDSSRVGGPDAPSSGSFHACRREAGGCRGRDAARCLGGSTAAYPAPQLPTRDATHEAVLQRAQRQSSTVGRQICFRTPMLPTSPLLLSAKDIQWMLRSHAVFGCGRLVCTHQPELVNPFALLRYKGSGHREMHATTRDLSQQ